MINKIKILILFLAFFLIASNSYAQQTLPKVTFGFEKATSPKDFAATIQLLLLLTVLSLAPTILITMTCFTRIIVILNFLRQALGTQSMPPGQLIVGLALFLTFFIMSPIFDKINNNALQPYIREEITQKQAFDEAVQPLTRFMVMQTRQKDMALFFKLAKLPKPKNASEVPLRVIVPAFMISELRIAFQIGFILYLPFLMIDMIVASILMAMGMLMLPPVMISLPFKILMFVLVDGWNLVIESIVAGFKV